MKLLGSITGIAGISVAGEEIIPTSGLPYRDLIAYITRTYHFPPQTLAVANQAELPPIISFANGVFTSPAGERTAITQLIVGPDGDLVSAQNTEIAETILADYVQRLERDLKYRITGARINKIFSSAVLVEFDKRAVEAMNKSPMGLALDKIQTGEDVSNFLKRVSFGPNASNFSPATPSVEQFISRDFIIERRANEPMTANRFYCTAPVPTKQHIQFLTEFERNLL